MAAIFFPLTCSTVILLCYNRTLHTLNNTFHPLSTFHCLVPELFPACGNIRYFVKRSVWLNLKTRRAFPLRSWNTARLCPPSDQEEAVIVPLYSTRKKHGWPAQTDRSLQCPLGAVRPQHSSTYTCTHTPVNKWWQQNSATWKHHITGSLCHNPTAQSEKDPCRKPAIHVLEQRPSVPDPVSRETMRNIGL